MCVIADSSISQYSISTRAHTHTHTHAHTHTYLSPLNDHGMSGQVDTPGQRCRGHKHLYVFVCKELLHKCPVYPGHASMMDGKPVGKEVLELNILVSGRAWGRGGGEKLRTAASYPARVLSCGVSNSKT